MDYTIYNMYGIHFPKNGGSPTFKIIQRLQEGLMSCCRDVKLTSCRCHVMSTSCHVIMMSCRHWHHWHNRALVQWGFKFQNLSENMVHVQRRARGFKLSTSSVMSCNRHVIMSSCHRVMLSCHLHVVVMSCRCDVMSSWCHVLMMSCSHDVMSCHCDVMSLWCYVVVMSCHCDIDVVIVVIDISQP